MKLVDHKQHIDEYFNGLSSYHTILMYCSWSAHINVTLDLSNYKHSFCTLVKYDERPIIKLLLTEYSGKYYLEISTLYSIEDGVTNELKYLDLLREYYTNFHQIKKLYIEYASPNPKDN